MRAQEIVVLDVRDLTDITDLLLLATCTSGVQMRAIAEELRVSLKHAGVTLLSCEGQSSAWWTLLDFGDVVVHLFTEEARRYYSLELLWGDAPKLQLA